MRIIMNIYILPIIMFIISLFGILLNNKNIILLLICIEMMLLSISLHLILGSILLNIISNQAIVIYIFTIAAVESCIGLAIIISFYKIKGSISINYTNLLKG